MEVVQLKIVLSLLFAAFLIVPSVQAKAVRYCDRKGNYAVKVSGIEMSPDPVVRGEPATFSIIASTGEAISGGKMLIDVSYFGVPIHKETHDLCGETSCPVSLGDFVISHTQVLPGYTPPGSYTLKMTMSDADGNVLTCVSFDFKIRVGSSVAAF
ncbi:putative phosphatidylglycerol/phosphatidylinositol transfer protein DDB_G0282179 [Macadamia integrifolia]|uniref:putative phosphatidylglycerol/phosphatidylinositol transfer protein DDB_G0282179 n=1 Tax=Macadamia integrifolia TaxID=60698 RepID=UPI001C4F93C8|nr:putative phosphatidylglycerol/phosphatidylinositol transfer protein DDB_G0282179 [Macadamia integrifolia]